MQTASPLSPLPSVRNQRKKKNNPVHSKYWHEHVDCSVWGFFLFYFFSFFPLLFRFVLFVSLFLSKDARSCSNLFSRLTFSGLSSTGRASKGAKKNPSKDEPPPGRPVGRSSRAARGNVHRCWRVRPGARGGLRPASSRAAQPNALVVPERGQTQPQMGRVGKGDASLRT